MSKIMVVVGHPQTRTFCEALAEAYREGAESAGHEVKIFPLAALKFDPILHYGFWAVQPLEADLQNAYQALAACDHLVVIFPLWCGDMPALLKGFIERILQPDLIERDKTEGAMNWALFKNKTARIVMRMGMPVSIYRFWYGAHALKLLSNNILRFIGIKPVRHTLFGMVATSKPAARQRWLDDVRRLGAAAA
jgi:putative NADPH-quinone reductase